MNDVKPDFKTAVEEVKQVFERTVDTKNKKLDVIKYPDGMDVKVDRKTNRIVSSKRNPSSSFYDNPQKPKFNEKK